MLRNIALKWQLTIVSHVESQCARLITLQMNNNDRIGLGSENGTLIAYIANLVIGGCYCFVKTQFAFIMGGL